MFHCILLKVSCGSWHAAAITDNGALFTWGYSKASAQVLEPKNFGYPSLIGLPFLAKVKGLLYNLDTVFNIVE